LSSFSRLLVDITYSSSFSVILSISLLGQAIFPVMPEVSPKPLLTHPSLLEVPSPFEIASSSYIIILILLLVPADLVWPAKLLLMAEGGFITNG
jgi:hypothetical protein